MFQEIYMRKIMAVLAVMGIAALFAYTYSTIHQTRYSYEGTTSISVGGVGEVQAVPDIAEFSFTLEANADDAITAQNEVAKKMENILAYLHEQDIEDKDIKTGYYNLAPRYEYPETVCGEFGFCPPRGRGEPKLIGYQVSQLVTVKVRDTEKAGDLVSGIGAKGAQNVSGLTFTIDDVEVYKAQARELAINDAKMKAKVLIENLGARIIRMDGYWEEDRSMPFAKGMGGEMMMADEAVSTSAAQLPVGENTIRSVVNISYIIR